MTWWDLITRWELVTADLQQHYAVCEPDVMGRPWPWFRSLVWGLLDIPEARITRALTTN